MRIRKIYRKREFRAHDAEFFFGGPEAFRDSVSVCAHEAAHAELDASEIADDMREHIVEFLPVYCREDWPSRAAAGLPVVIEAVSAADAVSPAVVRRIWAFEAFDGLEGGFWGVDVDACRDEARFFDLDGKLRFSKEFVHEGLSSGQ